MSLTQDLAQFRTKLNTAVDFAMENYVGAAAVLKVADAVETEVYAKYPEPEYPLSYVRRHDKGGLSDISPDNIVQDYDPVAKTLTVTDMNRDNYTGRLVAPVVESGEGYYYNFPFNHKPREFHSVAEKNMITSGAFEEALEFGLTAQGFKVKRI